MQKPDIERLPTSQLMKLCQVFKRNTDESREDMVAALDKVSDQKWEAAKVDFQIDEL